MFPSAPSRETLRFSGNPSGPTSLGCYMERVPYLVHPLRSGRRHMVPLLPGQWTDCNADYSHCCCGLSALEMQSYQQQCHQNSLSLPDTAKKREPLNKILRKHSVPGHNRNHRLSLATAKLDKSCKSSRGSLRNNDKDGESSSSQKWQSNAFLQYFFYTNNQYVPRFPQQILRR